MRSCKSGSNIRAQTGILLADRFGFLCIAHVLAVGGLEFGFCMFFSCLPQLSLTRIA